MEIKYDKILVDGDESAVYEFAGENGVIIDWRHEDDSIVEDFAVHLDDEKLSAEWTDEGLSIDYNGVEHEIPLTFSLKDRYITIRGLIELLKDKYEIRVFENSLGSDTHIFYIKPKEWWSFMDANFPERMKRVFFEIDDELDFGAGRDRFKAFGTEN